MHIRTFPTAAGSPEFKTPSSLLRIFTLLLVLLTAGFAGGCGDDPASATTDATAGHIKGKVVDYQGKGIPGVKVSISTATFGGGVVAAATATTKADGTYDVTLPEGVYGVRAEHTVVYNGRQYREYMSPDDAINGDLIHESKNGYVKNFTWKISGEIPGQAFSAGQPHHYGGYIDLRNEDDYNYAIGNYSAPYAADFPIGATFEITLTPNGPMLDGSPGSVVTRNYTITEKFWHSKEYQLLDIPVGRYSVSVTRVDPNGTRKELRVTTHAGNDPQLDPVTPALANILEFFPTDFSTLTHGTWGTELFLIE